MTTGRDPADRLDAMGATEFELRHMMLYLCGYAPEVAARGIDYIEQWRGDAGPIRDVNSAPIRLGSV
jgi:hypothetical protein